MPYDNLTFPISYDIITLIRSPVRPAAKRRPAYTEIRSGTPWMGIKVGTGDRQCTQWQRGYTREEWYVYCQCFADEGGMICI